MSSPLPPASHTTQHATPTAAAASAATDPLPMLASAIGEADAFPSPAIGSKRKTRSSIRHSNASEWSFLDPPDKMSLAEWRAMLDEPLARDSSYGQRYFDYHLQRKRMVIREDLVSAFQDAFPSVYDVAQRTWVLGLLTEDPNLRISWTQINEVLLTIGIDDAQEGEIVVQVESKRVYRSTRQRLSVLCSPLSTPLCRVMSQLPNKRKAAAASPSVADSAEDGLTQTGTAPTAAAATEPAESKRQKADADSAAALTVDGASSVDAPIPSAEHIAASPMLRLLGRDTGAQSVLIQLLDWPDCAALHVTCRSWRAWLDRAPITHASGMQMYPSRFACLSRCRWVVRFLKMLELLESGGSEEEPSADEQESLFNEFLACAHRMSRLECLHVNIPPDVRKASSDNVRSAFMALTKLQDLVIETRDSGCDAVINAMLSQVHLLTNLRGLEVIGEVGAIHDIDFSQLPQCVNLNCLRVSSESVDMDFVLSPKQFRDIAGCKTITDLDIGVLSWMTPDDLDVKHDDAVEIEWIDEHAGLILAAKQNANAASSGVSALKHLTLRNTAMSPLLWDRLVLLTELEELDANSWLVGMSAAQWSQLPLFTHLTRLAIHPHPSEIRSEGDFRSVLLIDDFLGPLLRCATLTSLTLGGGLEITRSTLEAIVAKLTRLNSVEFDYTYLETLEPLQQAEQLESLTLSGNTNLAYQYLQYRPLIPALPHLTQLRIDERRLDRLSAEAVAPLNAALLERCPLLTLDNFRQTLLEEEDNDGEAEAADAAHSSQEAE